MKITKFAEYIANMEGKKKQVNIAQIKEIFKCINRATEGLFYVVIRWI